MKTPRLDYYSLGDAVTFGIRPQVTMDDSDKWEVYVKLSNGNRVTIARDGTKPQAARHLANVLNRLETGEPRALIRTLDECFVDAHKVIRIYLDGAPEGHVAMIEDCLGEAYRIQTGDRRKCRTAVMAAVQVVASLHAEEEGGADVDTSGSANQATV